MKFVRWAIALALLLSTAGAEPPPVPRPLKVGVTLHPYYSWTANVVHDCGVEVIPILPGRWTPAITNPAPRTSRRSVASMRWW